MIALGREDSQLAGGQTVCVVADNRQGERRDSPPHQLSANPKEQIEHGMDIRNRGCLPSSITVLGELITFNIERLTNDI